MTLQEERKLRVFENRVLRRIFGPRRDEVTGEWRRLHNESSKWRRLGSIIKKDRFKMAAVVGLSTSLSKYFVRMECI